MDTNILVYAHREDSPWHGKAWNCLKATAEQRAPWAIPYPCLCEFLAVVTHPRLYQPPTTLARALEQIRAWMESPSLVLLTEEEGFWSVFEETLRDAQVSGSHVHDARIAALCRLHGVQELWTLDRDFSRFRNLKARNPLH